MFPLNIVYMKTVILKLIQNMCHNHIYPECPVRLKLLAQSKHLTALLSVWLHVFELTRQSKKKKKKAAHLLGQAD